MEWQCHKCTYLHKAHGTRCAMCGALRTSHQQMMDFITGATTTTASSSDKPPLHDNNNSNSNRRSNGRQSQVTRTTITNPYNNNNNNAKSVPVLTPTNTTTFTNSPSSSSTQQQQQQQQQQYQRPRQIANPYKKQITTTTGTKSTSPTITHGIPSITNPPNSSVQPSPSNNNYNSNDDNKLKRVEGYVEGPVNIRDDKSTNWIYPFNEKYPERKYQLEITKSALMENTLVSLPTGLGKTLIAAVVMYNYYNWFPTGKVLFLAPTRPLVTQQIQACFQIVSLPEKHTAEMSGKLKPTQRQQLWNNKRVFYSTPQTLLKDLQQHNHHQINHQTNQPQTLTWAKNVVCLIFDEAHKATGNYAYTQVIPLLEQHGAKFRILGLSATPGTTLQHVQEVIYNLRISNIQVRLEHDKDVMPYIHTKHTQTIYVPPSIQTSGIEQLVQQIISPLLQQLKQQNAIPPHIIRSIDTVKPFTIRKAFLEYTNNNNNNSTKKTLTIVFLLLEGLLHAKMALRESGMEMAYKRFRECQTKYQIRGGPMAHALFNGDIFNQLMADMKLLLQQHPEQKLRSTNPKLLKLQEVLVEFFQRATTNNTNNNTSCTNSSSRAIVFAQWRDSVEEIVTLLNDKNNKDNSGIQAMKFVGQKNIGGAGSGTTVNSGGGMTQKEQQRVLQQFKRGLYNVLVCTAIGEEGLDIGQVDLIVNFDCLSSPIRMIQRTGRTGRQRDGRVVSLISEGSAEADKYERSKAQTKRLWTMLQQASNDKTNHNNKNRKAKFTLVTTNPPILPYSNPILIRKPLQSVNTIYHYSQVGGHTPTVKKKKKKTNETTNMIVPTTWKLTNEQNKERLELFGSIKNSYMQQQHQQNRSKTIYIKHWQMKNHTNYSRSIKNDDLSFQKGDCYSTLALQRFNDFCRHRIMEKKQTELALTEQTTSKIITITNTQEEEEKKDAHLATSNRKDRSKDDITMKIMNGMDDTNDYDSIILNNDNDNDNDDDGEKEPSKLVDIFGSTATSTCYYNSTKKIGFLFQNHHHDAIVTSPSSSDDEKSVQEDDELDDHEKLCAFFDRQEQIELPVNSNIMIPPSSNRTKTTTNTTAFNQEYYNDKEIKDTNNGHILNHDDHITKYDCDIQSQTVQESHMILEHCYGDNDVNKEQLSIISQKEDIDLDCIQLPIHDDEEANIMDSTSTTREENKVNEIIDLDYSQVPVQKLETRDEDDRDNDIHRNENQFTIQEKEENIDPKCFELPASGVEKDDDGIPNEDQTSNLQQEEKEEDDDEVVDLNCFQLPTPDDSSISEEEESDKDEELVVENLSNTHFRTKNDSGSKSGNILNDIIVTMQNDTSPNTSRKPNNDGKQPLAIKMGDCEFNLMLPSQDSFSEDETSVEMKCTSGQTKDFKDKSVFPNNNIDKRQNNEKQEPKSIQMTTDSDNIFSVDNDDNNELTSNVSKSLSDPHVVTNTVKILKQRDESISSTKSRRYVSRSSNEPHETSLSQYNHCEVEMSDDNNDDENSPLFHPKVRDKRRNVFLSQSPQLDMPSSTNNVNQMDPIHDKDTNLLGKSITSADNKFIGNSTILENGLSDTPSKESLLFAAEHHQISTFEIDVNGSLSQRVENNDYLISDNDNSDIICAICMKPDSSDEDPIVLCDGPKNNGDCPVSVHKSCYEINIDVDSVKHWHCDVCDYRRRQNDRLGSNRKINEVKCFICGCTGGALRRDPDLENMWYHPTCLLLSPYKDSMQSHQNNNMRGSNNVFANLRIQSVNNFSFDDEIKKRNDSCMFCEREKAIKCSHNKCQRYAHPFCSFNAAPLVNRWTLICSQQQQNGNRIIRNWSCFCSKHNLLAEKTMTTNGINTAKAKELCHTLVVTDRRERAIPQRSFERKRLRKINEENPSKKDHNKRQCTNKRGSNHDVQVFTNLTNNKHTLLKGRQKRVYNNMSKFFDMEADIASDQDVEGDDEELDMINRIEKDLSQDSFINDSSQLGYTQDPLDLLDKSNNGDFVNNNDSPVTDETPGAFHRTVDFAQKCASQFETPIFNRKMYRRHRAKPQNVFYDDEWSHETPPQSTGSNDSGLGKMHFIRSVIDHHRKNGDVNDIEDEYLNIQKVYEASDEKSNTANNNEVHGPIVLQGNDDSRGEILSESKTSNFEWKKPKPVIPKVTHAKKALTAEQLARMEANRQEALRRRAARLKLKKSGTLRK